jgi:hypothetical protein
MNKKNQINNMCRKFQMNKIILINIKILDSVMLLQKHKMETNKCLKDLILIILINPKISFKISKKTTQNLKIMYLKLKRQIFITKKNTNLKGLN